MKSLIYLCLTVSVSFACDSSKGGGSSSPVSPGPQKPIAVKPTPSPGLTPDPTKRYQYRPAWLSGEWRRDEWFIGVEEKNGEKGIYPGEEPIADSLYRFWEGIRGSWTKSIKHGSIPKEYLSLVPKTPDGIEWIDATGGIDSPPIPGFEKLKGVLPEMYKRCPSLLRPDLQAPLQVVWATEDIILSPGQFLDNFLSLSNEEGEVKLHALTTLKPMLRVRAEWVKDYGNGSWDGWRWPKQTFKEQTGGKSYGEDGFASFSIDETFAHEYGHFLVQAWAMNHGRSNIQSQHFSESFAELVRTLCWGGFQDRPAWVKSSIDYETGGGRWEPFSTAVETYKNADHRFAHGSEYNLDSLDDLITWEAYNGRYEPDLLFQAAILSLDGMEGVALSDYPVTSPIDGVLTDRSPWAHANAYTFDAIRLDVPKILTKQEFLRGFCKAYESLGRSCDIIKPIISAEAEGLERDEW